MIQLYSMDYTQGIDPQFPENDTCRPNFDSPFFSSTTVASDDEDEGDDNANDDYPTPHIALPPSWYLNPRLLFANFDNASLSSNNPAATMRKWDGECGRGEGAGASGESVGVANLAQATPLVRAPSEGGDHKTICLATDSSHTFGSHIDKYHSQEIRASVEGHDPDSAVGNSHDRLTSYAPWLPYWETATPNGFDSPSRHCVRGEKHAPVYPNTGDAFANQPLTDVASTETHTSTGTVAAARRRVVRPDIVNLIHPDGNDTLRCVEGDACKPPIDNISLSTSTTQLTLNHARPHASAPAYFLTSGDDYQRPKSYLTGQPFSTDDLPNIGFSDLFLAGFPPLLVADQEQYKALGPLVAAVYRPPASPNWSDPASSTENQRMLYHRGLGQTDLPATIESRNRVEDLPSGVTDCALRYPCTLAVPSRFGCAEGVTCSVVPPACS